GWAVEGGADLDGVAVDPDEVAHQRPLAGIAGPFGSRGHPKGGGGRSGGQSQRDGRRGQVERKRRAGRFGGHGSSSEGRRGVEHLLLKAMGGRSPRQWPAWKGKPALKMAPMT